MRFRSLPVRLSRLSLLLCLWLAPSPAARCAEPAVAPLPAAVAQGQARALIHATGATSGDVLWIEVVNLTSQERRWVIPRGAVAASQSSLAPDMAVRRVKGESVDSKRYAPGEIIQLAPGQTGSFVCEAYSLNFAKADAAPNVRFELSPPQPFPRCLFEEADRSRVPSRVIQAALWIHSNNVALSDLARQFPVSRDEFVLAQGLVRMCESRLQGQTAAPGPAIGGAQSAASPTLPPRGATLEDLPDLQGAKPDQSPLLQLEAGSVSYALTQGEVTASIPILFRWNAARSQRPRQCLSCVRFESQGPPTSAVPKSLPFEDDAGRYDAVVERGILRGRGEIVYAVFRDLTPAADEQLLESLFDNEEQMRRYRISNVVRVPVDWDSAVLAPAEPALVLAPTPSPTPPPAPQPAPTPASTPQAAALRPQPTPTPRTGPVEVALPLKNGGILRGFLIGREDGNLVLESRSRRFTYDPKGLKHSPAQLLAEAKRARAAGLPATALQYAATAAFLLDNPSEAEALVQDCRKALAEELRAQDSGPRTKG